MTTDAADPITAVTASRRSVQLPLVHPTLPSLPTSTRSDLLVLSSSSRWFLIQSAGAGFIAPGSASTGILDAESEVSVEGDLL